jgi:multicomponent Na+:H+ antiporter subunit D
MVQLGLFAVARLRFIVFAQTFASHEASLQAIFLFLGVVTVLIGGLMCYAEHHLKRMLAFSTVCHAGIMLFAIALGGPLAFAAMLVYLVGHAFVKGSLFLTSGILLHRLRAIGERSLFARGRRLRWTAALWFLGALGLAAAPPFLLMTGEAGVSKAAEQMGRSWISGVCMFGGMLTSAATLRIGMHTFFGWGTEPITDEAAEIGELPETASEDQHIFWYQFVPAAISVSIPILLLIKPVWLDVLGNASAVFARQSSMLHLIYLGDPVSGQLPGWSEAWKASAMRGAVAFFLAILLACTSIFRLRLKRGFRVGPFLESGLRPLRAMQSGHPGDYVLWLTIGLAVIGATSIILLRT